MRDAVIEYEKSKTVIVLGEYVNGKPLKERPGKAKKPKRNKPKGK